MDLPENGLLQGDDGTCRCWWPGGHADYIAYHDKEWGRPVANDFKLFEKIVLEGFQSGLSWLTILRKRDRFREVFEGFDFEKIARFTEKDVDRLVLDAGIIRHRRKIESAVNNAQRALAFREGGDSLASFLWSFEPPSSERPERFDHESLGVLSKTPGSIALAKALKNMGWSFFGPTTAYAFMQSVGMVNDHLQGCDFRNEVEMQRKEFVRP